MLIKIALAIIITEASAIVAKLTAANTRDSGVDGEASKDWNKLQVYVLVSLSLALHLVLIILGYVIKNRRGRASVALLISVGYFLGDLVATTALTTLLKLQIQGKIRTVLEFFWAPFLLLHLGSVETIAAHVMTEDKLWQTYTLGIFIVYGISFYMDVRFDLEKRNQTLSNMNNFILVVVFLKCWERIWILRFSGLKQIRKSVLEGKGRRRTIPSDSQGFSEIERHHVVQLNEYLKAKSVIPEATHLHQAYQSFKMFVPILEDTDLRIYKKLSDVFSLKVAKSAEEAFQLVATELGFLFDVLHTKTLFRHIYIGIFFRFLFFVCCTAAFLVFSCSYAPIHKHYHQPEVYITYLLLLGAVIADFVALISHLFSKWTLRRLTNPKIWRRLPKCLHQCIAASLKLKRSWKPQQVKYMAQHSVLDHCFHEVKVSKFNAAIRKIEKYAKKLAKVFLSIQQHSWVFVNPTWKPVDADLKDLIFSRLQQKRQKYQQGEFKFSCLSHLANEGASQVLKLKDKDLSNEAPQVLLKHGGPKRINNCREIYDKIQWSINKVDFTHSLLLWHLSTDILFHYYGRKNPSITRGKHFQISKKLSDYMMHLLVKRSFMLQSGISKIRYRDTCSDAKDIIGWKMKESNDLAEAVTAMLLIPDIESQTFLSDVVGGGGTKSAFFKGCELAQQLQSLVIFAKWDPEELWEMISHLWVEMLFSAAYNCDWKQHTYQLGQGGELLTDVALLMAHLGLSKHLRMTKLPEERQGHVPRWDWDKLSPMTRYLA